MRRFLVLFIGLGLGLVGCVGETDTSPVDSTSDAVEIGSFWVGRDGLLYTGDRRAPIALGGVDFSRIGGTSQGLALEREEDTKRPPPTPLRVTQPGAPPPPDDDP